MTDFTHSPHLLVSEGTPIISAKTIINMCFCEYINQSQPIKPMDIITLLISVTSLIVACYAVYVSRVSTQNQIINSILTNISQQTTHLENFINDLLVERTTEYKEKAGGLKNGRALIETYQWSYILTPLVKSEELFTMYKKEYVRVLTPKQFDLILKTIYIQIPQLVKIRIFEDSLITEFEVVTNDNFKQTLIAQLETAKKFLTEASK